MDPSKVGATSAPGPGAGPSERQHQRLLGELFRVHAKPLERYFRRRGHSANDAPDLVQDVFVRLARCDHGLISARPGAMVFRLARFVSIDTHRRLRAQSGLGLAACDSLEAAKVEDGQPSPEQRVVWRQAIGEAVAAMKALPPKGGRAYWLYRVGELSQREIAAIQGVSLKTVEKQIAASAGRFQAILAAMAHQAA